MVENRANLEGAGAWSALLGYLNFSAGRPDAKFQTQLNDAFRLAVERNSEEPAQALGELLQTQLAALRGAGAFQDVRQVEAVLTLAFSRVLPAYRQHHADLLAHRSDRELFQPFFLARVCEAVLAQGQPWGEEKRIVQGALAQLNDFVGHRPVPILETRPRGEPYDHERVRPIPLYLRGAGVAWGRHHDLISRAIEILGAAEPGILAEAYFDVNLLDELAVDPRAYDHGHPVNRRPNYVFGEWDPHHIDSQGRYRRFVVRQVILDGLLDRVEHADDRDHDELLHEAAAVLAGTILMAAGISGSGPTAHDSTTTLATLVQQRIPRYRDAFYNQLIKTVAGAHGERLRQEMAKTKQPFGGVRQHLNQFLTKHRATQLQQRHLALLFAEMGYPEASRAQVALIATPSVRMLAELLIRSTLAQFHAERGEVAAAAELLPQAEDLLKRGIRCGAFADPWNILGFQGLFPLFASREDSVRDSRIDELLDVVERLLDLHGRLLGEAAGAGDEALNQALSGRMRRLAKWWDQFASITVGDVRRVHGGEATEAAEHVAAALARWHQQGEATAGLAFWRQHVAGFQSPQAFALVVDALLRKHDYRASMALLVNWLSHAEQVPLEDGDFSFHALALRWLLAVTAPGAHTGPEPENGFGMVKKFFDYLEANAEENWDVPAPAAEEETDDGEEESDPYGAAYEGVTYEDSTDDGRDSGVIDDAPLGKEFDLEADARPLEKRLRFLSTVARLWEIAARYVATTCTGAPAPRQTTMRETLSTWLVKARQNRQQMAALLDTLHATPVPEPLGSYESVVEYDRHRLLKEQLVEAAIGTCLDISLAVHALLQKDEIGTLKAEVSNAPAPAAPSAAAYSFPDWQPMALQLEQALQRGAAVEVRRLLPDFLKLFRPEPLLFVPLSAGGHPGTILRARFAQAVLQTLVEHLPHLGLLRETYYLLQTARQMETANPAKGRRVTEFDRLFHLGFQGVIETVVESARHWEPTHDGDRTFVHLLESLTGPFLRLWIDHSRTLQLSSLEKLKAPADWQALREFIQTYGRDLFHAKFMTLANLRGIMHRGIEAYLDYLRDHPDPQQPVRLIADLETKVPREQAVRFLKRAIRAVAENYEEYKDFKTTTPLSDYGENLHVLLDFLRLKASYDRHAWQFRPLLLAHEVLARSQCGNGAILWQEAFTHLTKALADQHLNDLAQLEQRHGFRLRSVTDRIEERFVRPMAIDRLCVLVGPAMEEARRPQHQEALTRFQEELQVHADTPLGAGLDVPSWLRRLQREVQRVRAETSTLGGLRRKHFTVPRATLTFEEVKRQLAEWDRPLEDMPEA